ncbi:MULTISPECIES: cytochrome d ubiquinol oxidase subunit II [unclassified Gemella]|uniref:cytochrome d ubiquinol oxidase subunit II n=1 Tax=unclassified Gemella TaxID=2624949 RepID=UPI0010730AF7|nr:MULTISPECIES: cytochrome d ubiquinol oxidase subunit II [unclassified Gemella]MBF0710124.1 cytochrome d ubiquinol oxidase subunit II [Gemella sp. GL1.1]MBF0746203.1 cytochrome d ubiquinol oxidase subunit II [Gemella sp. 19428wG2_WT2a]NYS27468.1 cytochrome d ubiquinol oxidase subunit II [Gemella sp. GL1]TFU60487.1 cytochrome d ubiquinol oxidase subunit II [Gemella sp. WT2a]
MDTAILLSNIWYILITVLFTGFFILEGYDFGVGVLSQILGKNDLEKRVYFNTIGPFWDANEVWLLTGGGAMFAAFPIWYGKLFSGYYIAFVLMLVALILRGVSFEFRGKLGNNRKWITTFDTAMLVGSFLPPVLWGVAVANFMTGARLDESKNMVDGFLGLLSPFALLGGLMMLLIMLVHGAQFLVLKTVGDLRERAQKASSLLFPLAAIVTLIFAGWALVKTDILTGNYYIGLIFAIIAVIFFVISYILNKKNQDLKAFLATSGTLGFLTLAVFSGMFPRAIINSEDVSKSLFIYDAASSEYTLKLMTIVGVFMMPIVIGNQVWAYKIFKKRLRKEDELEY